MSSSSAEHSDRNAEIWSTRVQRELLALTTDNAPEQDKKDTQGVLPSFITVKEHTLDIASGTCVVSFVVEIEGPRRQRTPKSSPVSSPTNAEQSSEGDDAETTATTETTTTTTTESSNDAKAIVTITLDASLVKRADGTLDTAAAAYPFLPPHAIVADGAAEFPEGSTLKNGDYVAIDCDWTPSLHLSDAVLNIGLKIKESILQQEPFHPAPPPSANDTNIDDVLTAGARAIGDKIGKFKGAFASKKKKNKKDSRPAAVPGEIRIGDEINLLEPPWVEAQGIYSCKAVRRPEFVEAAIQHAALESGETVSSCRAS